MFRANLEEKLNAALDSVAAQDIQECRQEEMQGINHTHHTVQTHIHTSQASVIFYCPIIYDC